MSNLPKAQFAFFGTPDRAVWTLDILKKNGYIPSLIVTQPDRPQGRKMIITPPPVKVWAEKEGVPVIQPEDAYDPAFEKKLAKENFDFFLVVAYGKILPASLLTLPKHGALNIHGSLLPKLRGSSPIETAILNDERETGATVILMDEKMDHGPIVAKKTVTINNWPPSADELAKEIVEAGANEVVKIIPLLLENKVVPEGQNHDEATYTNKIKKEDGLLDLNDDGYLNYRKYKAYARWPGVYFWKDTDGKKIRVKVTSAKFADGTFVIEKVIPEGKREMSYRDFTTSN